MHTKLCLTQFYRRSYYTSCISPPNRPNNATVITKTCNSNKITCELQQELSHLCLVLFRERARYASTNALLQLLTGAVQPWNWHRYRKYCISTSSLHSRLSWNCCAISGGRHPRIGVRQFCAFSGGKKYSWSGITTGPLAPALGRMRWVFHSRMILFRSCWINPIKQHLKQSICFRVPGWNSPALTIDSDMSIHPWLWQRLKKQQLSILWLAGDMPYTCGLLCQ